MVSAIRNNVSANIGFLWIVYRRVPVFRVPWNSMSKIQQILNEAKCILVFSWLSLKCCLISLQKSLQTQRYILLRYFFFNLTGKGFLRYRAKWFVAFFLRVFIGCYLLFSIRHSIVSRRPFKQNICPLQMMISWPILTERI